MKIEEIIKQKYLYKPGFNLIKSIYFLFQRLKRNKFLKKSYSSSAQDIIIDHFFKNKSKGVYIDVGCYHPYKGNNTKVLYVILKLTRRIKKIIKKIKKLLITF